MTADPIPAGTLHTSCKNNMLARRSCSVRHIDLHRTVAGGSQRLCRTQSRRTPILSTTLGIPADRTVVSGDSAGGHLALMLRRYIAESALWELPPPRCAGLFSPWTNVAESVDAATWSGNSNYRSDYIPARFAAWGACAFLGGWYG